MSSKASYFLTTSLLLLFFGVCLALSLNHARKKDWQGEAMAVSALVAAIETFAFYKLISGIKNRNNESYFVKHRYRGDL